MTVVDPVLAAMSERAFSQIVVKGLEERGWLCYRTWTSIKSPKGYPDITAVHPLYGLLFLELKRQARSAHLTPEQVRWLGELARWVRPERARVLRPLDYRAFMDALDALELTLTPLEAA